MEASSCPRYEDYRGVMIDIALEDTSLDEPALVDEVRRHIRACPHCRHEFNGYRSVVTLFTPPPVSEQEIEEIAANVRRRVLAKVAAEGRRRRFLRWSVAAACVAAVAALAVGTAPLLNRQAAKSTPTSQPLEVKAPPSEAKAPGLHAVVIPARKEQLAPVIVTSKPITPEQRAKLDEAKRLREEGRRLARVRDYDGGAVRLRKAIRAMQSLMGETPGREVALTALYEQYRCHELLGEHLDRERCFEAYVGLLRQQEGNEAAARALIEDAQRLIGDRDTRRACSRLEATLKLCPGGRTAFAAYVLMGLAAEKEQLFALAHSQYQMAIALSPSPTLAAKIYRNMVAANTRLGNLDAAIADAQALCNLPEEAIPLEERVVHQCLLAHLYTLKGDTQASVRILRDAVVKYGSEHTRYAQLQLDRIVNKAFDAEMLP